MPASHFENQTTGTSWCCNILREAEGISPGGGRHSDSPAALSEPFSFYLGGIVSAQMADCSLPIIPGLFSRKRLEGQVMMRSRLLKGFRVTENS